MPVLSPPPIQEPQESDKWIQWFIQINELLSLMEFQGDSLVFSQSRVSIEKLSVGFADDLDEAGVDTDSQLWVQAGALGESTTVNAGYDDIVYAGPSLGIDYITDTNGVILIGYGDANDPEQISINMDFNSTDYRYRYRVLEQDGSNNTWTPFGFNDSFNVFIGLTADVPVSDTGYQLQVGSITDVSTPLPTKVLIVSGDPSDSGLGGSTCRLELHASNTVDGRELAEIVFTENTVNTAGLGAQQARIWAQSIDASANTAEIHFSVNATELDRMVIGPSQIEINNMTTEDLDIVDAGSTGATEQDWIEVNVGGNQGFIRVFATK